MVHSPRPGERLTLSALAQQLQVYHPLDRLNDDQRILIAARGEQREVPAGQAIADPKTDRRQSYFLLRGALTLIGPDGELASVDAEGPQGRQVIEVAGLGGPVRALSDCKILQIETEHLVKVLDDMPARDQDSALNPVLETDDPLYAVLMAIHGHLQSNRLQLPSLPDVAWRVRRMIDQENSTAEDIAQVVSATPAMAEKLIWAAQSGIFRGSSEIAELHDAIAALGVETTRQLVTLFALRELFRTDNPVSRPAMDRLWQHTREVAAVSWALARAIPGVNPEEAMLAGLLHGVGAIPVIEYAERYPSLCVDEKELSAAIEALQGEVGGAILRHWGFPEMICETAEQARQWHFDSGSDEARLVDVVLIAQMHALITQQRGVDLPVFSEVPAVTRLGALSLTPEQSLRVLLSAKQQIESLMDLLSGQPPHQ